MEIKTATCHPARKLTAKGLCRSCYSVRWKQAHKPRKPVTRTVITCGHPERKHQGFGLCRNCYGKKRYHDNKPAARARLKAWQEANPEKVKRATFNSRLSGKYGLTRAQYDAMVLAQKGLCATCGGTDSRPLCVDHDHTTGKVRGLLCNVCNLLAGRIEKNWPRTDAIIAYLLKHQSRAAA